MSFRSRAVFPEVASVMLNIPLRSACWMLVVFILAASGLVAVDIETRKTLSYTQDLVTGSIH